MNVQEYKRLQAKKIKPKNKYRAKQVIIDGIKFPSIKEGTRYSQLKLMEKAGIVTELRLQVNYKLSVCNYRADFVYKRDGLEIVEDTKGVKTPIYKLKKKMMLNELGITIFET